MFINIAQPISLPPYWLNHPGVVERYEEDAAQRPTMAEVLAAPHVCPLKIKWESETAWWYFPIDPIVAISSRNNIVKRSVLKVSANDNERRGTVKELWSQDDYDITISGIFMGCEAGYLPEEDIQMLRAYCEGRKAVMVESPIFTPFNIRRIAIESYEFPFTKGMENQLFTIRATSDDFNEEQLLIAR
ncbi:MAG: DUF6046 domain-containing protein [Paludibacter sp.]|nr:DUF6046 domain-containing protein [Bacteroidales bacterium]MCM1069826.1 DUF6046 domain-containing protein [Prevotella sp.]MCM1353980.1 DUF6046 domain-containing protein [Bacteroides sp.]MCM1443378.1 DUF6046 domain-containing protein [Muribaculum sp.]MCM1482081.1 DUF6046 domain-containing protein [Paludibacter sp.]